MILNADSTLLLLPFSYSILFFSILFYSIFFGSYPFFTYLSFPSVLLSFLIFSSPSSSSLLVSSLLITSVLLFSPFLHFFSDFFSLHLFRLILSSLLVCLFSYSVLVLTYHDHTRKICSDRDASHDEG